MTYSERLFIALVLNHANHMRNIIMLFLACPASTYFSILFYKGHDFRKKLFHTIYDFVESNIASSRLRSNTSPQKPSICDTITVKGEV